MIKKYTSLLLKGVIVCIVLCFLLIWGGFSTGNTNKEEVIYVLLIVGFCLLGGAYINEKMSATNLPPIPS